MGWGFPWLSSLGSDFNFDYGVSFGDEAGKVDDNYRLRPWGLTEARGIRVFLKDGGQIYHTYSTYERGLDLCALHGLLPFNLMRSAAVAGARYGWSCLGCSAALMVAMVFIGMSSLWWAMILGLVVLVYKLAPPLRMRDELALSLALVGLGVAYFRMA